MTVAEAIAVRDMFLESPVLAVLVVLAGLVAWGMRTDALGVVSRRKHQRRARVFDTFEKLKEMNGLTEEDRASLVLEMREAGEGLSSPPIVAGEPSYGSEGEAVLPPAAKQAVQVADGVLAVFLGTLMAGMLAVFAAGFLGGIAMLVLSGGDISMIAGGLGSVFLFGWLLAKLGSEMLRGLAKKFPRRLVFLSEGMDWLGRRTELARTLGAVGMFVTLHLAVVAMGAVITYYLAVESESALGFVGAAFAGAVTAAIAVKEAMGALAFLGVITGGEGEAEVDGSEELGAVEPEGGAVVANGG